MSRVSAGALGVSVFLLAQVAEAGSPRIFGGEPTAVGDVPALAMILVQDPPRTMLCTGALISPRWVLTAAHCIDEGALEMSGVAGKTSVYFDRMSAFEPGGRRVGAKRVVVHPGYSGVISGHDVGLIELDEEITDRLPLAYDLDPAAVAMGDKVDFVGFGATAPVTFEDSGVAHTLRDRSVVPCAELGPRFPFSDGSMLCFDQRDDKGLCVGDSGGPVIADADGVPTIVGVNSIVFDPTATATSSPTCAYFAAATRTDAEAEFIEETQLTTGLEEEEEDGGCGCRVGGEKAGGGSFAGGVALLLLGLVFRRRR